VIYELRTYQLKVGAVQKYLQQFEHKGLPIISKYGTLVGYWTVDTGVLHRVIHIWTYNDLEHRQRARWQCMQDKDWTELSAARHAADRSAGKRHHVSGELLANSIAWGASGRDAVSACRA
jgi:hypothetical protein